MYEVKQATVLCILLVMAGVKGHSDPIKSSPHIDDTVSLMQLKRELKKGGDRVEEEAKIDTLLREAEAALREGEAIKPEEEGNDEEEDVEEEDVEPTKPALLEQNEADEAEFEEEFQEEEGEPVPALQNAAELALFAPDLKDYGVKLFGSEAQLDSFLRNTDPPAPLLFDGINMLLKQGKGDSSVKRLSWESQDSYGLYRITQPKGVLLDIGTNIGAVSIALAKKFPDSQVLTVEPIPSTHFIARLNMRLNEVKTLPEASFGVDPDASGVLALQRAVASESKVIPMEYSLISSQDSLVEGQRPKWEAKVNDTVGRPDIGGTWETVNVRSLVLPQYLAAHKVHKVNFMKMDCEGCEFDAVPHMSPLLGDVNYVELFAGEIHRDKVAGAMYFGNTTAFNDVLSARGCPLPVTPTGQVVC